MKNMFKGNLYALTMRAVEAVLGKETAQRITEEAFAEYLRTKPMHDIKNRVKNLHWLNCCEQSAIYLTLKKYCSEQAYELDVYIYGNLNDFEFMRNGTLGTGSEKCDFYFKRR